MALSKIDEPSCKLQTLQKDLRLAINMSDTVDQPLHVGAAVNEVFCYRFGGFRRCVMQLLQLFPSVLWQFWLSNRKGIWAVKSWVLVCFVRLLAPAVTTTSIILNSNKVLSGDILVLAYPGCPGKWPLSESCIIACFGCSLILAKIFIWLLSHIYVYHCFNVNFALAVGLHGAPSKYVKVPEVLVSFAGYISFLMPPPLQAPD